MEEIQPEKEAPEFSMDEILTDIWVRPKQVIEFIHRRHFDKNYYLLLFLVGVVGGLDRAARNNLGDTNDLVSIILMSVVISGGLGWISYYIYSAFVSISGNWMGGKAKTADVMRVVTYSSIPLILSLLVLVLQIAVFGIDFFRTGYDPYSSGVVGVIVGILGGIVQIILSLWTAIIFVIGISVIQKFSIGKAILNVLFPMIVLIVFVAMIFVLGDLF
ncbi:MAG: YIP1 family protein [Cytophagia bacterium]|nr:YIP1 family protein [Cytophagia bacterium]